MRTVRETLSNPALRSFSLCLDGWISVRKHRYLGFVALTPARPVFLGCAMLPHSEDARSIKAATLNFLNSDVFRYTTSSDGATYEVDLRHKIDAIVSDRASAMLAAIRDTQECLVDDGINVAHTGCTSHGGNLLSQDILRHEYLAPAIQHARRLGNSLRNRTKACTYLDSVGLTRFPAPCSTRWSSILCVMSSFLQKRKAMRSLIALSNEPESDFYGAVDTDIAEAFTDDELSTRFASRTTCSSSLGSTFGTG